MVDGVIDGQLLSTDPIPQDVSTLHIQTELAWEMEHKTLQQHRLCRTPIKLQVCQCMCMCCRDSSCVDFDWIQANSCIPVGVVQEHQGLVASE